jgi:hypothetical protein
MRIEGGDLALSMSESNAAMNFIEEGARMFLPESIGRERLFKRLVEYRARVRAA